MEPQESLLSDELREELGDDSIIVGKKVKKESGPQVSEESLKIATKLSKAAKKRKLQVEIRKEKETQRQASFDLIKKHEISDAHRDLMRSSREIGQNMTHGQTVKHLFKKHRLGIELSEAELGTLLTTREEQLDKNEESGGFELKEEGIPSSQHINSNQDNTSAYSDMDTSDVNAPLIDLTSLLRSEETSNHEQSDVPKPSKKGSKKSKVRGKKDSEPTNESVGSTLLAKFNLLKEKLNKSSPHITPTSEVISKHNEPYPDNEVATNTTIYIPSSINLDALISRSGQVQNEARSDDNSVVTQSLLTKKKLIATILSNTETKLDASLRVTRKPVPVYRNASVQAARLGLPICRMEQEIVEAINENDVIVLCGETGSGKSTQIPQFLFEAGYTDFGRIAVTQPRRVAATSTADRVRFELCGDQSRQNSNSTKRCVSSPLTITSPSNGTQVHSELLGTLGLTGSRNTTLGRLKVLKVPPSNQSARFRLKVVNALEKKVQGLVKPTDSKKTTTKVNANTSFQSLPAGLVGHQIRFDSSTVGEDTHIVFMTDGILLREIASDLLLRRYCAVVVDEAHERGVNTDILLGMLSRAVLVRKKQAAEELSVWNRLSDTEKLDFEKPIQPLKIIIMSATLKISDFQNPKLFPEKLPPIVNVETRQYPVTVHFAKHTNVGNYLGEAFKKVTQIHKRLPAGGILVFLTGKREIQYLCRKLRTKLLKGWHSQEPTISATGDNTIDFEIGDVDDEDPYGRDDVDVEELENNDSFDDSEDDSDVDIDDDNDNDDTLNGNSEYDLGDDVPATKADGTEGDEEEAQSSDVRTRMLQSLFSDSSTIPAEATTEQSEPTDEPTTNSPVKLKPVILPLYAMLSAKQQNKIFQTLPPNCRLIVVATNVAETSITIPGIRYVIDCGRQKEQIRLMPSGISKFEVKWISQMAAEQRKGRAGRVGPGHVYRLYSSAFFDQQLPRYSAPTILSTPLEDLLLQMKSMGIHDIDAFPFPTPPPVTAIKKAQDLLLNLGALAMSEDHRNLSSMDIIDFIKKGRDGSSAVVTQEEIDRFLLSQQSKSHITELGKLMAQFPLSPRFSKMLVVACRSSESNEHKSVLSSRLVQFTLSFIAALSEKSPFMAKNERRDDDGSSEEDSDNDLVNEQKDADLSFHPHGDILARMRTFSAYAYTCCNSGDSRDYPGANKNNPIVESRSTAGDAFSRQHQLHQSTLQRSFDLRQQIAKVLAKSLPGNSTGDSNSEASAVNSWWALSPVTVEEESALRQIMLSGYCDCIAKKAPIDLIKTGSRRKRMTAYVSCDSSIVEPLYLHPGSTLYRKDPAAPLPEYVLYESLLKNKRGDMTYMSGVTVVQKQWIASVGASSTLLKWSPPLQSPLPFYDNDTDSINCYCIPKYGPHVWELPVAKRRMIECTIDLDREEVSSVPIGFRKKDDVFRWFARLLLEGRIPIGNAELKALLIADNMLDSPSIITAMRPLPKVINLVSSLTNYDIHSKSRLIEVLRTNPTFLAPDISEFLKPSLRSKFMVSWSKQIL